MIIKQTELQKASTHLPTQLDFFHILSQRGSAYFSKEKRLYYTLKAGAEGEATVLQLLKEFGRHHWVVLQNVWMNKDGNFESDLILITSHCVYLFEIKHYRKKFTYENGICYYDNNEMPRNGIQQARRNHVYLKNICLDIIPPEQVRAAILFTGKNCDVEIKTAIDYLDIKNRTQIIDFIQKIAIEEEDYLGQPLNADKLIAYFEQYEVMNPYLPTPLTDEEMTEIRGGIYCAHCFNFNLSIHQAYVKCSCGLKESREEATIRTICDYGMLTFGQPMTRRNLLSFFDGQVGKNLLLKTVSEHFIVNQNGSHTTIENKNLLYSKIKNEFNVKKPKVLYTKDTKIVF